MEISTMVVLDPLTTDQWALWPLTHATLASLSIEGTPLGLVGVMECGVGQLQLVSVNGMDFVLFVC